MTFREFINESKILCRQYNKELTAIKLLIYEEFKFSSADLLYNYDENINRRKLRSLKKNRDKYIYKDYPVQYLIGHTYFYGNKIKVNKKVLIPRFLTEELVAEVIGEYHNTKSNQFVNILDLGTGSGCIAISLKKEIPNSKVIGVDISKEALNVARKNSLLNNVEVEFIQSDMFSNLNAGIKYDIIVSNPPYIDENEILDNIVLDYEPHLALFADNNGLAHYEEILSEADNYLNDGAILAFELGENQAKDIIEIVQKNQYYSDYRLLDNKRIMIIRYKVR